MLYQIWRGKEDSRSEGATLWDDPGMPDLSHAHVKGGHTRAGGKMWIGGGYDVVGNKKGRFVIRCFLDI